MPENILTLQRERLRTLLRQVRLEAGFTQVELAKLLKHHQSFVSKYESGARRLDLVEISQICNAVGISLEYFIQKFQESLL